METSPPPQTIVQAGGRVAELLVGGFAGAPTLLLIVILNIVMVLTAGYFAIQQEKLRHLVQRDMVILLQACILDTLPEKQRLVPTPAP